MILSCEEMMISWTDLNNDLKINPKKDLRLVDAWRSGGFNSNMYRATYEFDKYIAKELDIYKESVDKYKMTVNFNPDGCDIKVYEIFSSGAFKEILPNDKVADLVKLMLYEAEVERKKKDYVEGLLTRHKFGMGQK